MQGVHHSISIEWWRVTAAAVAATDGGNESNCAKQLSGSYCATGVEEPHPFLHGCEYRAITFVRGLYCTLCFTQHYVTSPCVQHVQCNCRPNDIYWNEAARENMRTCTILTPALCYGCMYAIQKIISPVQLANFSLIFCDIKTKLLIANS